MFKAISSPYLVPFDNSFTLDDHPTIIEERPKKKQLKQELRRARRRGGRTTQKAASAPANGDDATRQVRPPAQPRYAEPSMTRHEFLRGLHERLRPRTYVEIGVNLGDSLGLATCPAIGIDPAYRITADIHCPLRLFKTTSDQFFEHHDLRAEFNGVPVDLGFIDGMHLAEFAYRDFVNLERWSGPASVFVLDDMLPRDVDEAARNRHTNDWAGDVYKVAEALRRLRPDLVVVALNTAPTGTVLVTGLDSASTTLQDAYQNELEYLESPDPQQVPQRVIDRDGALDPAQVLDSPIWSRLADLRDGGASADQVRSAIGEHGAVLGHPC